MSTRALVTLFAIPLLALAACSREKSDWRSAQAADSPESYEQFIAGHPDSTLVATARERLQQLAEEKDWRAAAETDTLEAYQQFLAQYPAGKWAQAKRRCASTISPRGAAARAASANGVSRRGSAPRRRVMAQSLPDQRHDAGDAAGYGVQLGAFSSAERANEEWKKLQADSAGTARRTFAARRRRRGAGQNRSTACRPKCATKSQARAICGGLKVANKPCVPVIPHP